MTIHEQITAFLSGDLTESAQVGELMHVLAVSPEKRALMIEQIRMSRAFATMGSRVAPSHALDSKLLSGIAAIDAGFPPAPPRATTAVPSIASMIASHPLLSALASIVLVGVGLGVGYLTGINSSPTTSEKIVAMAPTQTPGGSQLTAQLAATRDSLRAERSQLRDLSALHVRTLADLESQRSAARQVAATPKVREVIRYVYRPVQPPSPPVTSTVDSRLGAQVPLKPAQIQVPTVILEKPNMQIPDLQAVSTSSAPLPPTVQERMRPWQLGLSNNIRVSFPQLYGIPTSSQNILNDKELYLSRRVKGGETGMFSTFKIGAAVGRTLFSQVYHTNTGGIPIDTIYEQTPALTYARAFIAPEIAMIGDVSMDAELGAGVAGEGITKILGPFGTIGLNVEYHPLDAVSFHLGVSSWLLWTQFRGQAYTSTNLNGQFGGSFNF